MTKRPRLLYLFLILPLLYLLGACASRPTAVTILHFNDVYEIDAVEGGHAGGLARVATVLEDLKRTDSPLVTTLGGDYLSPSAIGTARVDGQPLGGRQMVAVLNALGLEWATFGNHEFDVSESAFRDRLAQATFKLVSSNVTDAGGQPFAGTVRAAVVPIRAGRRDVRIGLIGLTIDSNRKSWVRYEPPAEAAKEQIGALRGHVDAVVALTHLSLAQDQELVTTLPEIDVVLGGHEHENWMIQRGPHFTPIVKADANVRSIAVVKLTFGQPGSRPTVSARLQEIDDRVAPNAKVEAEVRRWMSTGFEAFKRDGFAPETVVATIPAPLDGRESTVRDRPGPLTDLIAASLVREVKQADVAVFNGGSVRIDDVLPAGPMTEYDIIRVLPFGGKVVKATFDGSLLESVLDVGLKNQGTGGFLQTWGVARDGNRWLIQGKLLNPITRYDVALTDFLLTGAEANLGFLTRTNPHVRNVQEFRDIRRAVIEEMTRRYH